jgi:hypothetical protein
MSRAADLPGYRRRIRIEARADKHGGVVQAMLEDDIHGLAVTLRHDGETVTAVEPLVDRMPWTTCPGAQTKLVETFAGVRLADVTARREKKANCTHLHDLAVLAAAHAGSPDSLVYDVFASDPVAGERLLELRRDGVRLLEWVERDGRLVAPAEIAGQALFTLRDWINALDGEPAREAARVLQWASLVAHGRTMPFDEQSNAAALPPNCYTFQPERAVHAVRNGARFDFSDGSCVPLAGFGDRLIAALD